jgi:hypothetical protein
MRSTRRNRQGLLLVLHQSAKLAEKPRQLREDLVDAHALPRAQHFASDASAIAPTLLTTDLTAWSVRYLRR